jgi:hypothetical protein
MCSNLYASDYSELKFNIDCWYPDSAKVFVNVSATIEQVSQFSVSVHFDVVAYQFRSNYSDPAEITAFWSQCLRKHIRFIYSSTIKKVLFCKQSELAIIIINFH